MSKRGLSAEELASIILRKLGFEVTEHRKPIIVNGIKIGEVDVIARGPDGERYAVEVKAGKVSVTDVRQAYTNAKVLGLKPLLVCKGFTDESAETLSHTLSVRVIHLPDCFLFSVEELESVLSDVVEGVLMKIFEVLNVKELSRSECKVIEAISLSSNFREAALKIGESPEGLARKIAELKEKGVNLSKTFRTAKLQSMILKLYLALKERGSS